MEIPDGISNLPDPILQSIQSLVPLKSAVRTSILSKRWRYLWKFNLSSATSLDFSEEFASSQSPVEFVATVDRYLQFCTNRKLRKLRILFFPPEKFLTNINKWITFAAVKEVEQLDLDLSLGYKESRDGEFTDGRKPFKLPSSIFGCVSLTHLSLSHCNFCTPIDFRSFDHIHLICFNHVNVDDDMLQIILLQCPILESLNLRKCQQLSSVRILGDDLILENFAMVDCSGVRSLQISAPKLQSLHLLGKLNFISEFINVCSLVDAFISSIGREGLGNYTRMLSDFAHVKILTLCTSSLLLVATTGEINPQAFPLGLANLQELQLLIDIVSEENLSCIISFFQLCPSPFLKKLFIRLPKYFEDASEISYLSNNLKNTLDVSFNHLKAMKLSNFRGSSCEMRLVKSLLEKASMLEKLVIVAPPTEQLGSSFQSISSGKKGLRILWEQISVLPKASLNLHIVAHEFLEDDNSLNPTHREAYCEYSLWSMHQSF